MFTCDECIDLDLRPELCEQVELDADPVGDCEVGVDGQGHQGVGHGLLDDVDGVIEVGYLAGLQRVGR